MKTLPWIICLGLKCSHRYSKREAEGDFLLHTEEEGECNEEAGTAVV